MKPTISPDFLSPFLCSPRAADDVFPILHVCVSKGCQEVRSLSGQD